ncbi:hypothetical protein PVAG01_09862 [Phlyctema vagabunda]|uniref:Uncharacterized protein n=1 Tax=Phlyctema vagabunda TaxID=108571 RepID=A0ABR4P4N5_9HELO
MRVMESISASKSTRYHPLAADAPYISSDANRSDRHPHSATRFPEVRRNSFSRPLRSSPRAPRQPPRPPQEKGSSAVSPKPRHEAAQAQKVVPQPGLVVPGAWPEELEYAKPSSRQPSQRSSAQSQRGGNTTDNFEMRMPGSWPEQQETPSTLTSPPSNVFSEQPSSRYPRIRTIPIPYPAPYQCRSQQQQENKEDLLVVNHSLPGQNGDRAIFHQAHALLQSYGYPPPSNAYFRRLIRLGFSEPL